MVGLLIGIGITGTVILLIINLADLKIELSENYEVPSFLFWSLAFIPAAFMEEVAFRLYPFLKLNKAVGLRLTQVVLAVLFALYHVGEGFIISVFVGPGVWAFVYGMAAVYSIGIALPTGLHFGANFVLASFGDKQGIEPIWIIHYVKEATPEMMAYTESVGTIFQLILLAVAVFLMERYISSHRTS
ncbi:MAG: membrane protease YdiL (CAAX protease family) [Cyclobacteriaceae bacterium]